MAEALRFAVVLFKFVAVVEREGRLSSSPSMSSAAPPLARPFKFSSSSSSLSGSTVVFGLALVAGLDLDVDGPAFFAGGFGLGTRLSDSVVDVRPIFVGRKGLKAGVFAFDEGYTTCSLGSFLGGMMSYVIMEMRRVKSRKVETRLPRVGVAKTRDRAKYTSIFSFSIDHKFLTAQCRVLIDFNITK